MNSPLDLSIPDDGFTTLREAVSEANANPGLDEIVFAPSLSGIPIVLGFGAIHISDDLSIRGLGVNQQLITTNYASSIFNITNGSADAIEVSISDVTLTRAMGAVISSENLTLSGVIVSENIVTGSQGRGAGLQQQGGSLTITGSTFIANRALGFGGGAYVAASTLLVSDSLFEGNSASWGGGLLVSGIPNQISTALITRTTFHKNVVSGTGWIEGGGVSFVNGVHAVLRDSVIRENSASQSTEEHDGALIQPSATLGGGLSASEVGSLLIDNSTISNNRTTGDGGGLFMRGVTGSSPAVVVANSLVSGNSAEKSGGGIGAQTWFALSNTTVASNTAELSGGGAHLGSLGPPPLTLIHGDIATSRFVNNQAGESGGAISMRGASVQMTEGVVEENLAPIGGGFSGAMANFRSPSLVLTRSLIQSNHAQEGGGIYGPVTVTLNDSRISGHSVPGNGAGLYLIETSISGANGVVEGNSAGGDGGGIYGARTVRGLVIRNNSASNGGGVAFVETVDASVIADNSATLNGGGVYRAIIINSEVSYNTAEGNGGGASESSFVRSRVHHNVAYADGGGGWNSSGIEVTQSEIYENTAGGSGGGLSISSTAGGEIEITESELHDNAASGSGGGLYIGSGVGRIEGSAIYANEAGTDGGGLYAASGRFDSLNNTISGNSATGSGGGVMLPAAYFTFDFTTIALNSAASAPGLIGTSFQVNSSIVAANLITGEGVAYDYARMGEGLTDATYSVIGSVQPGAITRFNVGNVFDADPMLGPLADNGGLTPTHALLEGSPAVDMAFYNRSFHGQWDQRGVGYMRAYGATADAGAYELIPPFDSILAYGGSTSGMNLRLRFFSTVDGRSAYIILDEDQGFRMVAAQPGHATEQIVITGAGDVRNTLKVDAGAGLPIPSGGLIFAGNDDHEGISPTASEDTLLLFEFPWSSTQNHHFTFTGPYAGSIRIGSANVQYAGVEAVQDKIENTFSFLTMDLPDGAFGAELEDVVNQGILDDYKSLHVLGAEGVASNHVHFTEAVRLVINLGNNGQNMLIGDEDSFRSSLVTVNGGVGNDRIAYVGTPNDRFNLSLFGHGGDDYILGTEGVDFLSGGEGNDTLLGIGGRDTLIGREGDDSMHGGDGADVLQGGSGNDTLLAGVGWDSITGGAGNDSIDGGDDIDVLVEAGSVLDLSDTSMTGNGTDAVYRVERAELAGTDGDDQITARGFSGQTTLSGSKGSDELIGGSGNDCLVGGDGDDSLTGNYGDDSLDGGDGVDLIAETGASFTLTDLLLTGHGSKQLVSIERAVLAGTSSADLLDASAFSGRVTLDGGDGDDTLRGGSGDDLLVGGLGNDYMSGGAGNDSIYGDDGDDTLDGGAGSDLLIGGNGRDSLSGSDGNDSLYGGNAADTLGGGDGSDWLDGGNGNDSLDGGSGVDTIDSGSGKDTIIGGTLEDLLLL